LAPSTLVERDSGTGNGIYFNRSTDSGNTFNSPNGPRRHPDRFGQ